MSSDVNWHPLVSCCLSRCLLTRNRCDTKKRQQRNTSPRANSLNQVGHFIATSKRQQVGLSTNPGHPITYNTTSQTIVETNLNTSPWSDHLPASRAPIAVAASNLCGWLFHISIPQRIISKMRLRKYLLETDASTSRSEFPKSSRSENVSRPKTSRSSSSTRAACDNAQHEGHVTMLDLVHNSHIHCGDMYTFPVSTWQYRNHFIGCVDCQSDC